MSRRPFPRCSPMCGGAPAPQAHQCTCVLTCPPLSQTNPLQGCPRLRRLVLRHCGAVTDAAVRAVAVRCKQLQARGGSWAAHAYCVAGEGPRKAAQGGHPRLHEPGFKHQRLQLGPIPSAAFTHSTSRILASRSLPGSQELVLEHTAVGDAGVLHAARGLPALRTLRIANYAASLRHLAGPPGGPWPARQAQPADVPWRNLAPVVAAPLLLCMCTAVGQPQPKGMGWTTQPVAA